MKLLIFKTDTISSVEERQKIAEILHVGIRDGILFLDGNYTYEVAEFDSITYNQELIMVPKKKYDRNKYLNEIRRKFEEAKRKDEEALNNENTKD